MGSALQVETPEGVLKRISLLGVLGLPHGEDVPFGTHVASVQLWDGPMLAYSLELTADQHLSDPLKSSPVRRSAGDGSGLETMGQVDISGRPVRVDLLTIDSPAPVESTSFVLRTHSGALEFYIFDVFFHMQASPGCPFHSKSNGISLSEVGALVRVGDRARLNKALDQLVRGLDKIDDLDEARGLALTFIAIVTAASLESGGTRLMHRIQLDAARDMDRYQTPSEIGDAARHYVNEIVDMIAEPKSPSSHLIDRSLAIVNRNFAKPLSDEEIAAELGLSTSHFRHLFKEATGQPFHRYLMALRLERARRLLVDFNLPVSEVASSVGFSSLAHFSRAFAQRFQSNPSAFRRMGKGSVL